MFEKKEDKLFDFAFGELSAQEAQLIEAELMKDAPSQAEVDFLRTMKSDLASFRDIPEMQYSKERLRSAILEQGLKPKKPIGNWLNWVLAPSAMAGVFALGFILMNGVNRKAPTYVPGPDNRVAMTTPKTDMGSFSKPSFKEVPQVGDGGNFDRFPDGKDLVKLYEGVDNGDQAARSPRSLVSRRMSGSRPKASQVEVQHNGPVEGPVMVAMNFNEDFSAKKTFASVQADSGQDLEVRNDAMTVAFPKKARKSEAKVIEINRDQDSGIGAAVATEVSNTTDVVIGG